MRKVLSIILILAVILSLSGCWVEGFFYSAAGSINGFDVATCKFERAAFVSQYNCTEYVQNMEITIPDEYGGFPVTTLGGSTGTGYLCPFGISLASYVNTPKGSEFDSPFSVVGDLDDYEFSEEYNVECPVFRLVIGKNIEVIEHVEMNNYYPHINEDGSITLYHPVVYIICSEENEHFYSKDGKLYDKKTDELITEFAYAN